MVKYAKISPANVITEERNETQILPAQLTGQGMKAGWRWMPIVIIEDDQSTTEFTFTEPLVQSPITVASSQVKRTRVIRDLTPAEIDAQRDQFLLSQSDEVIVKAMFLAFNAICYLATHPHNANLTSFQIRTAIEDPANQMINWPGFRSWLKDMM